MFTSTVHHTITFELGPRLAEFLAALGPARVLQELARMSKLFDDLQADLATLSAAQATAVQQQAETLAHVQQVVAGLKAQVADLTEQVTKLQQSLDAGALTPEEAAAIRSQIADLTAQANALREGIRAIDPGDSFTVNDITPPPALAP